MLALNLDEELIKSIQEIGQNYAIEHLVLFGSRSRGDHRPASDIDLAVFLMPEFNSQGRMTSDFDDLNTLLKIDTVFIKIRSANIRSLQYTLQALHFLIASSLARFIDPQSRIHNINSCWGPRDNIFGIIKSAQLHIYV